MTKEQERALGEELIQMAFPKADPKVVAAAAEAISESAGEGYLSDEQAQQISDEFMPQLRRSRRRQRSLSARPAARTTRKP